MLSLSLSPRVNVVFFHPQLKNNCNKTRSDSYTSQESEKRSLISKLWLVSNLWQLLVPVDQNENTTPRPKQDVKLAGECLANILLNHT